MRQEPPEMLASGGMTMMVRDPFPNPVTPAKTGVSGEVRDRISARCHPTLA
jgi:hypothetical protein